MNNKAKTSRAAAGVAALAAGIVGTSMLAGQLAAETPDPTTVAVQQPAPTSHYTGPTTPDAAEHWLAEYHDWGNGIVDNYVHRIANDRMSMQDFESIAGTRLASGEWTQGMVDRIVRTARTKTVADLYKGCEVYSAGRLVTRGDC